MADPSEKSLEMGMFLEAVTGRTSSINDSKCVQPPFGCGGDATAFRNEVSAREYQISGLCQLCQDSVFAPLPEEEPEDYREDDLGYPGKHEEW
jgi:hypothetical protein